MPSSSTYPKLELKYCERCGGLWLRPLGGEEVYCARCQEAIAELPPVRSRGPRGPIGDTGAAYTALTPFFLPVFGLADQIGGMVA